MCLKTGEQTEIVRKQIDESPYPSVICGDFNAVPNSYTYFKIKATGRMFSCQSHLELVKAMMLFGPTLRIDYILPDNHFNVNQFQMVDEALSDHHLLVSDLSLKNKISSHHNEKYLRFTFCFVVIKTVQRPCCYYTLCFYQSFIIENMSQLKVYNNLTRTKEVFESFVPGHVGMYVLRTNGERRKSSRSCEAFYHF